MYNNKLSIDLLFFFSKNTIHNNNIFKKDNSLRD